MGNGRGGGGAGGAGRRAPKKRSRSSGRRRSASASRLRVVILGERRPRSSSDTASGLSPARAASPSWDMPARWRYHRSSLPNVLTPHPFRQIRLRRALSGWPPGSAVSNAGPLRGTRALRAAATARPLHSCHTLGHDPPVPAGCCYGIVRPLSVAGVGGLGRNCRCRGSRCVGGTPRILALGP